MDSNRSCLISILLFILIVNIENVDAYRMGDVITFSKRSMHDMKSTDWTEIRSKLSPRFLVDKTITLNSLTNVDLTTDSLYKISFQFIDKFTTTWITVADGKGTFLNHIEFTFHYSNNKIVDVKYNLDYNDEDIHHGKKPEHIYLIYKWEQVKDKDFTLSLFILFFTGIALGGFVFTYNAFRFQMDFGSSSKKKRKEELPTFGHGGYNSNNDWKTFSKNNDNSNDYNYNTSKSNLRSPKSSESYDISNSNGSIPTPTTIISSQNSSIESGGNFGFEAIDDSEIVNFDNSPNLSSISPTQSKQHTYTDTDKDK